MKNKTILFTFLFIQLFIVFNIVFAQTENVNKELPITTSSNEARQLFVAGRDAMENAEIRKATELFTEAIEEDEDFALAYLYLAFLGAGTSAFTNNLEKAMAHSEKISEGEKLFIQMGKLIYADKNNKAGMELLDKLILMYPGDARLYFYKGVSRSIENDSAIVYLKKAIQLNPDYATVYNTLGYLYLDKKNYDEAENNFRKYINLAPEISNSYDSYAEFLERTGRYNEAIENYQKVLEIDNSNNIEYVKIGSCFIRKGGFASARGNYQKLFEKSHGVTTKLWALRLKIISYVYENKIDEALSEFTGYRNYVAEVEDEKEDALSFAYEGYVLSENDRIAEGLKKFQEAATRLEKLSVPGEQKNNLLAHANLDFAYAFAMNNDILNAKAKAELARTETNNMTDPDLKTKYEWTLGFIEYKGGNYDKMIERMKGINGLDALKTYYLAQAFQKSGDKVTAEKLLKEARNANINSWLTAVVWKRINEEF